MFIRFRFMITLNYMYTYVCIYFDTFTDWLLVFHMTVEKKSVYQKQRKKPIKLQTYNFIFYTTYCVTIIFSTKIVIWQRVLNILKNKCKIICSVFELQFQFIILDQLQYIINQLSYVFNNLLLYLFDKINNF